MEITDYIIVELECTNVGLVKKPKRKEDFENLVNEKIKEGFQPFGSLNIDHENKSSFLAKKKITTYSQAMVKYKK